MDATKIRLLTQLEYFQEIHGYLLWMDLFKSTKMNTSPNVKNLFIRHKCCICLIMIILKYVLVALKKNKTFLTKTM